MAVKNFHLEQRKHDLFNKIIDTRGKGPKVTAAFRLKNGIVPCSIVGNGPEGLVRVLARFERDALPCRCLVHPSRLLQSLPPAARAAEIEREESDQ